MSHTRKTTEFSTHLSRSRMRRYLHGQLEAKEAQQVELHLANCAHCSASLVNYIDTEESDQYNSYVKQLSGKLKEQKISKRPTLSPFQTRALRASAAVVALLIFSFFGVKTIINKEVADYSGDEKAVAVKTKPVVASKAKPVEKKASVEKAAKESTEKKADNRLAENRSAKTAKRPTATKKAPPAKKEVAKSVKPSTTKPAVQQPKKVEKPATQPQQKVEKAAEPKVATAEKAETTEKKPEPIEKVAQVEKLDKVEGQSNVAQESQSAPAPINTLPAVKKMDASKKVEISKPVGSTTPQVAPIPGGRLR